MCALIVSTLSNIRQIREHGIIVFLIRTHSKNAVFIYFQIKNINDERVEVTLMNTFDATEATPVSPYDSDFVPFQIIANSIHDVFNNAILTPGVMVRIFPVLASMYIFFYIPSYRLFFVRSAYFVTNQP